MNAILYVPLLFAVLQLQYLNPNAELFGGREISNLQPQEIEQRTRLIRVERIKEWSDGIERDQRCEHHGDRCSLGLVCTLDVSDGLNYCKPPKVSREIKVDLDHFILKERDICSDSGPKKCGPGLECAEVAEIGLRLCMVHIEGSSPFYGFFKNIQTPSWPSSSPTSTHTQSPPPSSTPKRTGIFGIFWPSWEGNPETFRYLRTVREKSFLKPYEYR